MWRNNKMTFKEWLFAGMCFVIFYLILHILHYEPKTIQLKEIEVHGPSRNN